ncbi:hypothetical protein SZ54_1349 [Rhizobium sp. UR51a]|nr:hypothetical protein SZ54_1349 [Rhizobium sp. UR51a]
MRSHRSLFRAFARAHRFAGGGVSSSAWISLTPGRSYGSLKAGICQ